MTRQEIIEQIAHSDEIKQVCRNISRGSDMANDLFQEVMLALIGQREGRLEEMYQKKQLKWFIIGIINRMWNNNKSTFYRTHRRFTSEATTIGEGGVNEGFLAPFLAIYTDEYDYEREEMLCELQDTFEEMMLDEQTWYEAMLMRHTLEMGSQRKVARATEIPYKSIQLSIKKFKERMREELGGADD